MVTDSQHILVMWRNYFFQLFSVRSKGGAWGDLGFRLFPGYFVRVPSCNPTPIAAVMFGPSVAVRFGRGSSTTPTPIELNLRHDVMQRREVW